MTLRGLNNKIIKKNIKEIINNESNIEFNNESDLIEKIKTQSKPLSELVDVYNGVKPFEKGKGKYVTLPYNLIARKERGCVIISKN